MSHSYSSFEVLTRCLKKYYYRYELDLEKVGDWSPAPYLGTAFHALQETRNKGGNAEERVDQEIVLIEGSDLYEEEKEEQVALWEAAWEMYERYHSHYEEDYEVLTTEKQYYVEMDGFTLSCTPDLVYRNAEGIWIRDYKTTQSIPLDMDFGSVQALAYLVAVTNTYGKDKVAGFEFDFVRSKAPTVPRMKKDGTGVAYLNTVDTTFEILRDVMTANGLLDDSEHRKRLAELKLESEKWFKRIIIWNTDEMRAAVTKELEDRIALLRGSQWAAAWPRSFVSKGMGNCDSCGYNALCRAEWFGHNTKLVLRGYQTRASRHDEEEQEWQS
jgi:hypothetical protein